MSTRLRAPFYCLCQHTKPWYFVRVMCSYLFISDSYSAVQLILLVCIKYKKKKKKRRSFVMIVNSLPPLPVCRFWCKLYHPRGQLSRRGKPSAAEQHQPLHEVAGCSLGGVPKDRSYGNEWFLGLDSAAWCPVLVWQQFRKLPLCLSAYLYIQVVVKWTKH